ncbi:DUF6701 domain-containing protein [Shewanella algae]|uniref:DUF6701 domain-containing protein n=1 Tax=Shewanella algae TaxID=38313 RepID=UPI003AAD1BB2
MNSRILLLLGILLGGLPALALAVPQCSDIFTDPPTGNHFNDGFVPPANLPPSHGNLTCRQSWFDPLFCEQSLAPGDYDFDRGSFSHGSFLNPTTTTTRLYFDDLELNNATLNPGGKAENLIIYVRNSLSINGHDTINAILYVEGAVQIAGNGSLDGALASGGALVITGNSDVDIDLGAVEDADFGGMCSNDQTPVLGCFSDDFSSASLSADDWAIKVLGNSVPPSIVGGRLRLTPARGNQATSSTYQRLFPAEGNLVTVEFDYYAWSPQSGTGGDGVAVILSDAAVTPQPGSFGGALGYAQRNDGTPGFAGGWLGVALDEYGNFSNPTEGRVGGPGFRRQAVSIRGAQAGSYRYLTGTVANIYPKIDVRSSYYPAPGHRYKITVDSRQANMAMVSVERDTGAGYQTLVSPFNARSFIGQGSVPTDFYLSLTGSTGGSNNNHEIDNFQVCALDSKAVGEQVHHFEFDYSSAPFTCRAEPITLRACKNASCSELFTGTVTANLSPNPVSNGRWLPASSVTFNGGSTQIQLQKFDQTPLTLGVSSSTPATRPGSDTLCRSGSGPLSTAACRLSFADSGFIFDVADKLANKPETGVLVKAMKSDGTAQCVPAFASTNKMLSFWSEALSAVVGSPKVQLKPTGALSWQDIGSNQAAATPLTLAFDSQGQSRIDINYADAGRVELNILYRGTTSEGDAGLVMHGADDFVSFPLGFCVEVEQYCQAADASCAPFRRAQENFPLSISAKAWADNGNADLCNNLTTPSYQQADLSLWHKLIAPASGQPGELQLQQYDHLHQQTPENNRLAQAVSEVGVFEFGVTAPLPYEGSVAFPSLVGSAYWQGPSGKTIMPVGRFVPAFFRVDEPSLLPACNGFSYMDQPFEVSYKVSALALDRQVTQNYVGDFAKAYSHYQAANQFDGVALDSRVSGGEITSDTWVDGLAEFQGQLKFARKDPVATDGPFPLLDIGLEIQDPDKIAELLDSNMQSDFSGDCSVAGSCSAVRLGSQKMRHGRLLLDNTFGPETQILSMAARTEYWDGSGWRLNALDNCSVFNTPLEYQQDQLTLGYHYEPALSAGQSISRSASGGNTVTAFGGEFELLWRALGSSGYRGKVTAPLKTPEWLQWYWNWNGLNDGTLSDPRASAFFGRYRGNDRIISWREVN